MDEPTKRFVVEVVALDDGETEVRIVDTESGRRAPYMTVRRASEDCAKLNDGFYTVKNLAWDD